jgi:Protein of unknown function (DUF3307)
VFFFLLAGHALADYPLQTGAIAICKCRHANHPLQKEVPWYYWMLSHALVILKWWGYSPDTAIIFGIMETVIHFIIDVGKCEKFYGIAVDQALHVICKVLWCTLLATTWFTVIV